MAKSFKKLGIISPLAILALFSTNFAFSEEVRLAQITPETGPPMRIESNLPTFECPTCLWNEVKRALQARGYNPGIEDMTFDQTAIDALKKFQRDNNLEPDGRFTSATLRALGISDN